MDIEEKEILQNFIEKHSMTTVDFNNARRLLELIRYTIHRTYNFYYKQEISKKEKQNE